MKRWFWVLDLLVVVAFVLIGRDAHGLANDWREAFQVALPFLLALSVGVGLAIAFMDPAGWLAGLAIAGVTVVGGLAVRKYVFEDGTATTFMVLTAGWMTAWMVGWRLVAALVIRLMASRGVSNTV